jgi:quaternary ammonium compound-resistance protein SugE
LRNLTDLSRGSFGQDYKKKEAFEYFSIDIITVTHKNYLNRCRTKMEWIFLFIAGLFEAAWAIGLKYTEGFTRLYPSIFTVVCMVLSFYFLSQALKILPIGTGYAVWTGIGILGTTVLGILLFNDSMDFGRLVCIILIFSGVMGLKLISP